MKNFVYLPAPYFSHFENITNSKKDTVKTQANEKKNTLLSLFDEIRTKYKYYEDNFDKGKLHLINSAGYVDIKKLSLLDAYTGNGKELDKLKSSIKKLQHQDWQNTCPYCGILSLSSTDHYLPKEDYSEYAVLAINLVPCCLECNNKKGTYWKANNARTIINFYLDDIPEQEFLTCDLKYEDAIPVARYKLLQDHDISAESFNLIKCHYDRLNLLERYKDGSNDEITSTLDSILSFSKDDEPSKIKSDLITNYQKRVSRYGVNHWRCALLKALYNSNVFLDQASTALKTQLVNDMIKI
ncbi:hypothetical protein AB1J88_23985 [Pseudomonas sp. S8]|uniref:HNH endonuclease n=1 Tax=Pseudomonas sp. S8 TaxID=211136 RepID=UPI003D27DD07